MPEERIKVVFIGGDGRSGSTLLDRMLGQVEGFVSAGELKHIWKRGFAENQLCGCGSPFRSCTFWQAVVEEAFGSYGQVDLKRILLLQQVVDRARNIPLLLMPALRSAAFQNALSEYTSILSRLYKAIHKVSGAKFIVDSSKSTSAYGFILSSVREIELYVVHLIRDSRAVAYSWQRKKQRPEIYWKKEYMPRYSPLKSVRRWTLANLSTEILGLISHDRYIMVRYEDMVSRPSDSLRRLLAGLGVSSPSLSFIDGRTLKIGVDHTVSGNPIRFERGEVEVKPDTAWREEMPVFHRMFVSTLTWPLLLRYGYIKF